MGLNEILLTIAALFPALALMIYVFIKDRAEKEPLWLLIVLFICGISSCFPVIIFSTAFETVGRLFCKVVAHFVPLTYKLFMPTGIFGLFQNFIEAFIFVALVEEGFKWIFMIIGTKNHKEFNSLFDGIVYGVFVALGFAAFENILYVFGENGGWSVAIMRAILSVPGHAFFGVLMGYYYSLWHVTAKAAKFEQRLKSNGVLDSSLKAFDKKRYIAGSILMPILAHGFFDFCLFTGNLLFVLIFYVFVIFLYIFCIAKIRKFSKADSSDTSFAVYMLYKKYPDNIEEIRDELFAHI